LKPTDITQTTGSRMWNLSKSGVC